MYKNFLLLTLSIITLTSCIPTKIAPRIEGDKVMYAKKFKRKLLREYTFIFEDPKQANEFYKYINTKYERNHKDVRYNTPIIVDGITYYLTFRETERQTETVNLVPIAIDAVLDDNNAPKLLKDVHVTRTGIWYILISVRDDDLKDCLHPNYKSRAAIIKYLRKLRHEYLNTMNYLEVLLKKKSSK